jgi:hypothetical protein
MLWEVTANVPANNQAKESGDLVLGERLHIAVHICSFYFIGNSFINISL